jgi:hypothetical protein
MNCICSPSFHKSTALTNSGTEVNITVTNSTNISSLDCFELVLCNCPDSVVTGAPLPYTVTVNGTAVALLNKYSLPIYTNRLKLRKRYYGAYVESTTGSGYVILWNTPDCAKYAVA